MFHLTYRIDEDLFGFGHYRQRYYEICFGMVWFERNDGKANFYDLHKI